MVFSSLTFLYLFLPAVAAVYFLIPCRAWRNAVLLVASVLFYSWGEPRYMLLMILASLVAWGGGLAIDASRDQPGRRRLCFWITTGLLVLNLLGFKYLNLFVHTAQWMFHSTGGWRDIALPIGISFYTFQILSYVIDLYRGEILVQKNYFRLALYVMFFPQMIAGPIVRYQTIEAEITSRQENWADAAAGVRRFILGLAKKVILANGVSVICETVYGGDPDVYGTVFYWIAAAAYTLQIYFDFSGYSDMAIGMGRIFGFHFLENFDYPYISLSVKEFWRRWHISLSSWFRDYIYIPLGGNRCGKAKWIRNVLNVWALTRFSHGAQWNFMLWGLYYAVLLLLERLALGKLLDRLPKVIRWFYTAFCVTVGYVIFNLTDFSQMLHALKEMFFFAPTDLMGVISASAGLIPQLIFLPTGLLCAFPVGKAIRSRLPDGNPWVELGVNLLYTALLLISLAVAVSSSYDPFIYFRF